MTEEGRPTETVIVGGRPVGVVLARSQRFVLWSEEANELYAQGEGLALTHVATMAEGPRRAAISADEQWAVVVGLGFLAFRLVPGTPLRAHGRRRIRGRGEIHQLVRDGALLYTGVRALDGHRFMLSTVWGLENTWTTRAWVYDADGDVIGDPVDTVDVERRRRAVRTQVSERYAGEAQLAARERSDGAETAAEAGITFAAMPGGGEQVLAHGEPAGTVLTRSEHFVVWQELGSMVCAEGRDLPFLLLEDMYGGATAAAISADEEWCVVVGCGLRARRLRLRGEYRRHGVDTDSILWLSGVRALDGHRFLATHRGGPRTDWLVREYLYDADADSLRRSREWVDTERRARDLVALSFVDQPLTGVDTDASKVRLRFGAGDRLTVEISGMVVFEDWTRPGHRERECDPGAPDAPARVAGVLRSWPAVRAVSLGVRSGRLDIQLRRIGPASPSTMGLPDLSTLFRITTGRDGGAWSVSSPVGTLGNRGGGLEGDATGAPPVGGATLDAALGYFPNWGAEPTADAARRGTGGNAHGTR